MKPKDLLVLGTYVEKGLPVLGTYVEKKPSQKPI
jgi:hypothetical protein